MKHIKAVSFCLLSIFLINTTLFSSPIQSGNKTDPPFINRLGFGIGANFPFGSGVLKSGAYPFGLSLHLSAGHINKKGHNYELLTGVEIMADFGGGIYMAIPVLVNRIFELTDFDNSRFRISGFSGLGYYFHHTFSRAEGIIVKNQHAFGLDAGLIFNYSPGKKWDFNIRTGAFRSFTKPVQANFSGTTIRSENKFKYATLPILINVSRKIGK